MAQYKDFYETKIVYSYKAFHKFYNNLSMQ